MVSRANCGVFMISVGDTPVEESGGSNPCLEPDFGEPLDEFLAHLFVFRTSLPVQSEDLGTLEHRGEIPIGTLNVFPSATPRLEGSEMPKNIMRSVKPRTGCAEAKRPGPLSRGFSHHFDS